MRKELNEENLERVAIRAFLQHATLPGRKLVGDAIREIRTAEAWTQGQLADRLGVQQPAVAKLEAEGPKTVQSLILVAYALELGPEDPRFKSFPTAAEARCAGVVGALRSVCDEMEVTSRRVLNMDLVQCLECLCSKHYLERFDDRLRPPPQRVLEECCSHLDNLHLAPQDALDLWRELGQAYLVVADAIIGLALEQKQ